MSGNYGFGMQVALVKGVVAGIAHRVIRAPNAAAIRTPPPTVDINQAVNSKH